MDDLKRDFTLLKAMLNSTNISERIEGVQRVIIMMTLGKNVTGLFQDMIKCLELPNLEIKKMIYLYIINNSRNCPDDALMIVNQFVKDTRNKHPLVRALAIRTMGYLRVERLNDYLIDPLVNGLNDHNDYVRKAAILCVPKVMEVSKNLVLSNDIPSTIVSILKNDSSASIKVACLVALKDMSDIEGKKFSLPVEVLVELLKFSDMYTEWDLINTYEILLDSVLKVSNRDYELTKIFESHVMPKLNHQNKAVVIATSKLIICYVETLESKQGAFKMMMKTVIKSVETLLRADATTAFIALQTLYGLEKKYRTLGVITDISSYYCAHSDPLHIKLLKLKILKKISLYHYNDSIMDELKNYFKFPEIEFSTGAVELYFKLACKRPTSESLHLIKKMIEEVGFSIIEHKNYKLVEYIIAGLNNFILSYIIYNKKANDELLKSITSDKILGELFHRIEDQYNKLTTDQAKVGFLNLVALMPSAFKQHIKIGSYFANNFFAESEEVQLQILSTLVHFFIAEIEDSDDILMVLFEEVNNKCHEPLIRDQTFIYWRLLISDPETAKRIFCNISKSSDINALKEMKPSKKAQIIKIEVLGTFLNSIYLSKEPKRIAFLEDVNYHKRMKKKHIDKRICTLESQIVFEFERRGRKGLSGFEIMAKVDYSDYNYYLVLNMKNHSNAIHNIINIEIAPNAGGLLINKTSFSSVKGYNIQKNEICTVKLLLDRDINENENLNDNTKSLSLDVVLETGLEDYKFEVPFLLNILLDSNKLSLNDGQIAKYKAQFSKLHFEVEVYDEDMLQLQNIFEANKVFRANSNFYYAAINDDIIGLVTLEKKAESLAAVEIYYRSSQYKEPFRKLIEQMIKY